MLFNQLKERTRRLANVRCYNMALAGNSGPMMLNVSGGESDGSSSLLQPKHHLVFHPQVTFDSKTAVTAITLDDWAIANNIGNVDFLWLDLQGSEFDVLEGSPKCLNHVQAIYTEVSLLPMYEGAPLYQDYRKWLEAKGFRVAMEDLPWQDMGNVLFVR
jgi:FkbM family methyltransferase